MHFVFVLLYRCRKMVLKRSERNVHMVNQYGGSKKSKKNSNGESIFF